MKMNSFETLLMNNPGRAFLQRHFATPILLGLGGGDRLEGKRALEIGCGNGAGVEILLDAFALDQVHAFDIDPAMVRRARKRLARHGARVQLWEGDMGPIRAEDARYDAVFGYGIIHHVPDWRAALHEVARVLVPGGKFYSEESYVAFLEHPVWRHLLDHPHHDRFDPSTYLAALEEAGLEVVAHHELPAETLGWVVARKPLDP